MCWYLYLSQRGHRPGNSGAESCGLHVAPVGERQPEGDAQRVIIFIIINTPSGEACRGRVYLVKGKPSRKWSLLRDTLTFRKKTHPMMLTFLLLLVIIIMHQIILIFL